MAHTRPNLREQGLSDQQWRVLRVLREHAADPGGLETGRVAREAFHLLDAPPMRLNSKDTPIPYHPNLWKAHRPTIATIAAALRRLLRY